MKKLCAVCGSPRKGHNTDILLRHYLEGAASVAGIETETVYLYDLGYTGCRACMACKLSGGADYGRCAWPDALRPVLERASHADGIVFGTPVFFCEMTAQMRAFIERLIYPFRQYKKDAPRVIAPKQIRTDFIYTMNVPPEDMERLGYPRNFAVTEDWMTVIFGRAPRRLCACDTWQYDDYGKYVADAWDIERKARSRAEQFPRDCAAAFRMGREMALSLLAEA